MILCILSRRDKLGSDKKLLPFSFDRKNIYLICQFEVQRKSGYSDKFETWKVFPLCDTKYSLDF